MENTISTQIINDVLNVYRDTIRSIRTPNRNFRISRYYNSPPSGGYQIDEEHNYILPDDDDISSTVLLELVTRFGSPETESAMKLLRREQIKNIGKCKKIKEDTEIVCSICLDTFKKNQFSRNLQCSHCFHKRCIDQWFRKDHMDCPMCRAKVT